MKKIISFFKPYTFRFCDVLPILNRNSVLYLIYYAFMILILSFPYHFEVSSIIPLKYSIFSYLKGFCWEFLFSSVFYVFNIYCIFIFFNKKINDNYDKINLTFSKLINLFCHLYTIPFLLDIIFIIIFNDFDMTDDVQRNYAYISILVSLLINVIYPVLFIRYVYKNKDKSSSILNCVTSKEKTTNKIKSIAIFVKDYLLINYDLLINKVTKYKFIYFILIFIIFSFIASLGALSLNPYYINLNTNNIFINYSIKEIFLNYVDLLKINLFFIFIPTMINILNIRLNLSNSNKKNKLNNIITDIKLTSPIYFIHLLLMLVYYLSLKIEGMSFIKPKLLPTHMVNIFTNPFYYIVTVYIIFITTKNLLYKYNNKLNK